MEEFKEIIERALNYYIHITSGELKFLKNQGEDTGHLEEHLSQSNSALNYIKNLNSNWIKISDKLPEEDGEYIVAVKGHYGCGVFTTALTFKEGAFQLYFLKAEPLYWMPLPEPPEEV